MTEEQRLEIAVGMRVVVKVAAREIPATVVEVGDGWFLVRSEGTGREFRTTRVVDILGAPEAEEAEIAQAAADIAEEEEEAVAGLREEAKEPPEAEPSKPEPPAPETADAPAEGRRPRKNLSLVDAAVEVLRAEKRPMGVKELVRLAVERGLWIPTKAKTPEQSLYGGLYLEMKNSAHPRIRRAAEKGRFELIG